MARFSLLRDPSMRNIMWSGVTLVTVQFGLLVFIALDLRDRLGLSLESGAGLLFVVQCAGIVGRIGLAAWSDRCRRGRYFPVVASMWCVAGGLIVLLFVSQISVLWLGLLAAWLGFFGFGWYGPWVAYVSESAPPDRIGFALGFAMGVDQVAIIASPPLLGLIRDWSGSYLANWALLVAMLFVCIFATRGRRRHSVSDIQPTDR